MMADIDRSRAESFSSVYVLDSHYQYQDVGVVNIFNSPAGRELVNASSQSPERKRFTNSQRSGCPSRKSNHDITKFVLNPENLLINDSKSCKDFHNSHINYSKEEQLSTETNFRHEDIQSGEDFNSIHLMYEADGAIKGNNLELNMESNECNGGVTRRLVNQRDDDFTFIKRPQLDKSHSLTDKYNSLDKHDDYDTEMRIDRKILRYNSTRDIIKQTNNFSGEKCDILRKLLGGFLSGWSTGSLSNITIWRKRKSTEELYREASLALGIPCELTDSCRCLECQCHYLDCGDNDSDLSDLSLNLNDSDFDEWSQEQTPSNQHSDVLFFENETLCQSNSDLQISIDKDYTTIEVMEVNNDETKDKVDEETKEKTNSDVTVPVNEILANVTVPSLEIAAGTPVILNHLLNTPMSCTIQ